MNEENRSVPTIITVSVNQISADLLADYVTGYLMNRDRLGIPLREHLRRHMTNLNAGATLAVDFTDIKEMTTSVAEQIGPRFFEEFLLHRLQNNDVYMAYCNVSGEIARGLEGAFRSWQSPHSRLRLTALVFYECQNGWFEKPDFLGDGIAGALKEILDLIYSLGQSSSTELEECGIKAASRKLNELFRQYPWLLRRTQKSLDTSPRAWAYFYSPIVPIGGAEE